MKRYGINMNEKIINIEVSQTGQKKYMAVVEDLITKKRKKIHFGDKNYQQFKDSTKLQKYTFKNHNDIKRKTRYYLRHSKVKTKREAVKNELIKSNGRYNAKILSHIYLW